MLSHWPYFGTLDAELNRLRGELGRVLGSNGGRFARPVTYPAMNLWEDEDNLFIEAEIPGIEPGDLSVFVNGGDQLTVQGERKQPQREDGRWHRRECGYGKFSRMVQLPCDVVADNVSAAFTDGVLTITLPKQEEARPRQIEVRTE